MSFWAESIRYSVASILYSLEWKTGLLDRYERI